MSTVKGSGGIPAMFLSARNPPNEPTASFVGKTVLVTGANAGLGLESAIKFASHGAKNLILGVRDLSKGEAAKAIIVSRSPIAADDISIYEIDCSSFSSVAAFAKTVSEVVPRIDVVLLNAGVASPPHAERKNGWEATLLINALTTVQLALELLPKLRETARTTGSPSVLNINGSEAHLDVQDDWMKMTPGETILEHWNKPENYSLERQYHVSKLLVMFAQQGMVKGIENKRSGNDPIIVVSTPGMCKTTLGREFGWGFQAFMSVFRFFVAKSAEEGSRALVASSALGKEAHGKFWMINGYLEREPCLSKEKWNELQPKAWAEILEILEEHRPGIARNVKES